MPNVPDITPEIILNRREVINLLLTSIALEEISLSHIMNAEAEKIQLLLKKHGCLSVYEALEINSSVEKMLRSVIGNQLLLQFKLSDVVQMDNHRGADDCYEDLMEE